MPQTKRKNIRKLKTFVVGKIKEEIPATLTYHGLHHTLDVLRVCNDYIKRLKINSEDAYVLRTAALMHDIGIMWNYQNHEEQGMNFVRNELIRAQFKIDSASSMFSLAESKYGKRPKMH